jgi:hypothetical protein
MNKNRPSYNELKAMKEYGEQELQLWIKLANKIRS